MEMKWCCVDFRGREGRGDYIYVYLVLRTGDLQGLHVSLKHLLHTCYNNFVLLQLFGVNKHNYFFYKPLQNCMSLKGESNL